MLSTIIVFVTSLFTLAPAPAHSPTMSSAGPDCDAQEQTIAEMEGAQFLLELYLTTNNEPDSRGDCSDSDIPDVCQCIADGHGAGHGLTECIMEAAGCADDPVLCGI